MSSCWISSWRISSSNNVFTSGPGRFGAEDAAYGQALTAADAGCSPDIVEASAYARRDDEARTLDEAHPWIDEA